MTSAEAPFRAVDFGEAPDQLPACRSGEQRYSPILQAD